ncbi:MAG: sulfotransferase [Planctomycetales bacterium]|nr:sulfotransferase [Planctomycetales bacterium]
MDGKSARTIPNFFIIGAPKCGTTALYEYLKLHPQVFMPAVKEPHFFADDLHRRVREVRGEQDYERLFKHCGPQHLAVGEASPLYMASATALANIKSYNPSSRVIAMVRNPLELVRSWHHMLTTLQFEPELDCQIAWELQETRRSQPTPRFCLDPIMLQYRQVASVGRQVERVYAMFPAEQVMTIVFDDFVADTQAVYEQVLSFLNVPSDHRTEFPRINEATKPKSQWLHSMLNRERVPQAARIAGRRLGLHKLHAFVTGLNKVKEKGPPLALDFRRRLAIEFQGDVESLSHRLGRDLSPWLAS